MRVRGGVAVLGAAVLLAACGGGSAPPTNTSSRGTPTSASPTGPATAGPNVRAGERPPAPTALAKTHTAAGARSFATYYVRALDWGIATTDPYLITQLSAASCAVCQGYVQSLTAMRGKGDSLRGARMQVVSAKIMTGQLPVKADYGVQLVVSEQAGVAVPAGSEAPAVAAHVGQDYTRVYVSWASDGWQVVDQTDG
jgi:Family of unknown function (DUF6318)